MPARARPCRRSGSSGPTSQTDAKTMGELAGKLAAAAGSGDQAATLAGFATLGKDGCGGCHETFRKKKS